MKAEQVKKVFTEHRRRYGARRISKELQAQGLAIGRYQATTLMRQQELNAIQSILVENALNKAINRKTLPKGLLVHSDGGGQYTSKAFQNLTAEKQIFGRNGKRLFILKKF